MLFAAGCSDDTPAQSSTAVGDPSDQEYLIVSEQIDNYVDSTLNMIKVGLNSSSQLATDTLVDPGAYGPIDPHNDSTSSTYSNGWHEIYISRRMEAYSTAFRDSIQYRDLAGDPQQTNTGLAQLTYIHQWATSHPDKSVDYADYDGKMSGEFEGLNGNMATVTGSNAFHFTSMTYSTNLAVWFDRTRDVEINGNIQNLQISQTYSGWSSSCPHSGSIAGTIALTDREGSGEPTVSNWSFSFTFNDGLASISIQRGNTVWNRTAEVCRVPGL
jgi:hypothetical protein